MKKIISNMSVRRKLIMVFLVSTAIMFTVNLYVFSGSSRMMEEVDKSYESNVELMDLEENLTGVRSSMADYLNTKSSDSLESYYINERAYTKLLDNLNEKTLENSSSIMEKNIHNMSEYYLGLTAKAVEAKRGRNAKEYAKFYTESEKVYEYIYTYIYSLNSTRFEGNTSHYRGLMTSLGHAETVSIVIMILVAVGIIGTLLLLTANIIDPLESHLTTARLKYLQAQINPHFLFNTLNAGAQLAMMEGADRTYSYIQNVADFYRYNISSDNDVATIGDEVTLIDNYIFILNVRFANELIFEKDIDESLLGLPIPAMVLQPIVENAVNHGLRNLEREKKLRLCVCREDDRVSIAISDNGIGMSQDQIEAILSGQKIENNRDADTNGIGISNVIARLKMFYNSEDVIEITSTGDDEGTEVVIYVQDNDRR